MHAVENFDSIAAQHEEVSERGLKAWSEYLVIMQKDPEKHQTHLLVCELRNCIFANLMDVGWKVVLLSTGLPGFKVGVCGCVGGWVGSGVWGCAQWCVG